MGKYQNVDNTKIGIKAEVSGRKGKINYEHTGA